MLKRVIRILWPWFVGLVTNWMPNLPGVLRLRGRLYGWGMAEHGKGLLVADHVRFMELHNISVGDDVYIGPDSVFLISRGCRLGSHVLIAHKVVLTDGNHVRRQGRFLTGERTSRPISIGEGSWIAAHCTVLPGVTIGRGVVVGANSAVARDIPDNCMAGGVPARVIKHYGDELENR